MSPPQIRERYHSKIQVTQRNQEVPGQTLHQPVLLCSNRSGLQQYSRERDHRPRSNKSVRLSGRTPDCAPPWKISVRQRLHRSSRRRRRTRSPVARPARMHPGRGTSRAYPPAHSRLPPSRRGLPQVMAAVALCWRSHQPASCATGDARERPAAP